MGTPTRDFQPQCKPSRSEGEVSVSFGTLLTSNININNDNIFSLIVEYSGFSRDYAKHF